MIRILHTIDTTGPGGAETVFVNLVKGLDRREFEPIVAIRGPGWVCDELVKNGISPLFVNSKGGFNVTYLQELIGIIRRHNIDIVQSHLLGSNLYCSLAGMICGVSVVSTFHGFVDIHDKERFPILKRMIINSGSSSLIFVSDRLREFYVEQNGFSSNKSATICNGIDTDVFRPQRDSSIRKKLGMEPDNILVGAVGNIRPAKGYKYLLMAAKLVIVRNPQFRFVVAGEGSGRLFEDLLELRKKLELENHFTFLGFEPDVAELINNMDIFVLPSVSEGFSLSIIEAMSCGVPVIATRSGGPEDIITHDINGILVDACCPESLSDNIIKLHEDTFLRYKITRNCREDAGKNYSISSLINNYSKVYLQQTAPAIS